GGRAAGRARAGVPLAEPATRWQWSGLATGATPLSGATAPALRHTAEPVVRLVYRSTLASQSVLVAGSLPTTMERRANSATFQVAVTTATPAGLGVPVGSPLRTAGPTLGLTRVVPPVGPPSAFSTPGPTP